MNAGCALIGNASVTGLASFRGAYIRFRRSGDSLHDRVAPCSAMRSSRADLIVCARADRLRAMLIKASPRLYVAGPP